VHGKIPDVVELEQVVVNHALDQVERAPAEKHLAGHALSPEQRRFLQSFHRRETATLAAQELRAGELRGFREWANRGLRQSGLWPLTFARRCVGMWFD